MSVLAQLCNPAAAAASFEHALLHWDSPCRLKMS
jgi:hypothetical protein